jgi:hypothetical protein
MINSGSSVEMPNTSSLSAAIRESHRSQWPPKLLLAIVIDGAMRSGL